MSGVSKIPLREAADFGESVIRVIFLYLTLKRCNSSLSEVIRIENQRSSKEYILNFTLFLILKLANNIFQNIYFFNSFTDKKSLNKKIMFVKRNYVRRSTI